VTDFNAALRRLAGPALALGAPLAAALPDLAAALTDARGEVSMGHGGPRVRHLEWRATPLGGHRRGRLVLLRDVTERRAAETALRAALAELEARNEELDAFAHTVAHDLKNPIHVVHGYAELLLDEGDALAPELRRESATAILRTAGTMADIVNALLLLAGVRHQRVTPAALDTGALVGGALVRLAPLLKQHGATVAVPEAWPAALGHGPWVEEVWVNYLSNAAKYGGPAARIALGAEADDTADGTADGAHVRFWVRDHGTGLSPEAFAGLFAPFARFHDGDAEGHGLGLSIVRRVVGKLGGRVGAEAAPGGGATFWFTLPAAPVDHVAPPVGREAVDCDA
jgi:signal transduction histidine kinase